jgi:hypothetical protein
MLERQIFAPGIYDISNDEYHNSAGVSRSCISEFKRTPAHYYYKYKNPDYMPKKQTPDMIFGSAFHCYILEPEKFDDLYAIKPEKEAKMPEKLKLKDVGKEAYKLSKDLYDAESKRRKEKLMSFNIFSQGKTLIDFDDSLVMTDMRDALMRDKEAKELIKGAHYEQSIYWIDEDTGILCKCRPDILHNSFVVDLKTTKDASYREFQRAFYSENYYLQMAMIHLGIKAVTGQSIMNFIDLAIEKEAPYCHAIYIIDEPAIQQGIDEFKHYLFRIKECMDSNYWPSYPTATLSLPAYAKVGDYE